MGAGTACADDPELTVRGAVTPLTPPVRVVFDERAELPQEAALVRTAREQPTLVLTDQETPAPALKRLSDAGVTVLRADGLGASLAALKRHGIASVLVEGGATLAGRLLRDDLVDRLYLFVAPILLGDGGVPAFHGVPDVVIGAARRWRLLERRALGDDTLMVLERP